MTHGLHRLKDGLAKLVGSRGYGFTLSAENCERAWQVAAGPSFATRTRVLGLRRKVLEIAVADSVMMQELSFRRAALLQTLKLSLPEYELTELRFRIGHVRPEAATDLDETP